MERVSFTFIKPIESTPPSPFRLSVYRDQICIRRLVCCIPLSTFESVSAQNTWLRGSKSVAPRQADRSAFGRTTISFQIHSLTSPSVARRIMPKYETIFRPLFHPDPSSPLLPSIYTDAAREREHFFCGCKKAVKSSDGKISVFPRRSRLKATFRAITPACHRCVGSIGVKSLERSQSGNLNIISLKPKSFYA